MQRTLRSTSRHLGCFRRAWLPGLVLCSCVSCPLTQPYYQHRHWLTACLTSWDDWVPQERIRKFTDENKELAANLRRDMEVHRAAAAKSAAPLSAKRRPFGSGAAGSSNRGSEDRSSAAPSGPRGTKRSRDIEGIDKVRSVNRVVLAVRSRKICDTFFTSHVDRSGKLNAPPVCRDLN